MKRLILLACLLWSSTAWAESIPVQTIVLEAENQGFEGMVAVGEVIRNRALKARSTFEGICMAPKQFSAWNEPLYAKKRLSRVNDNTWKVAQRAWDASISSNKTQGATHYHTKAVSPYWAKGKRPCVVIGDHLFYNNVR